MGRRWLTGPVVAALAATVGLVAVAGPQITPARAATPDCGPAAATESAALARAAQCDLPIAIEASRSEYVQVIAQPDGRLTFESAVEPQRTKLKLKALTAN